MITMEKTDWGRVAGRTAFHYRMSTPSGMAIGITNYGAILTEVHVPDRHGRVADVALGFDRLEGYTSNPPYVGCIVGRVANRIGGARFALDGKEYALAANMAPNHVHGGVEGFNKKIWDVIDETRGEDAASVTMTYASAGGEEGYPGNLTASVTYTLSAGNAVKVEMEAVTDAPTIVNLAHHAYWNLAGHDSGDILDHELTLNARNYTPTDADSLPTGAIAAVAGTPFDFTRPKKIGADIGRLCGADGPGGYDINLVLDGGPGAMRRAGRATEPQSGRVLEVRTTSPGVQFYTGNYLDGSVTGKGGAAYRRYAGFCLETQHFPDAVNKEGRPGWPSVILRPGSTYEHTVVFAFAAE